MKEIYGWHVVHTKTGIGVAFVQLRNDLTEKQIMEELYEGHHLVALVRAGDVH